LSPGALGTRLSLECQSLLPKGANAIGCSLLSGVISRHCPRRIGLLGLLCFEAVLSALALRLDLLCVLHA
jgi:hypothetical protein